MKEADVVLARLPQSDGTFKRRPALILREMPPFGDFLLCGISTRLQRQVKNFDEAISTGDDDFSSSGLVAESLIRPGFLVAYSKTDIIGVIGSISKERHERLLSNLSAYLIK